MDLYVMESSTTTRRRTSSEMYALMSAYEESGQSRQAFCETHDLKLATFGYWRTRYLREKKEGSGFVSLIPTCLSGDRIELNYGDVVLRFGPGVSAEYLASLLKNLAGC